jgi:hypothetical protein
MALPESGLGRSRFQRDESGDRSRNSVSAGSVRVATRGYRASMGSLVLHSMGSFGCT